VDAVTVGITVGDGVMKEGAMNRPRFGQSKVVEFTVYQYQGRPCLREVGYLLPLGTLWFESPLPLVNMVRFTTAPSSPWPLTHLVSSCTGVVRPEHVELVEHIERPGGWILGASLASLDSTLEFDGFVRSYVARLGPTEDSSADRREPR